jgi:hypothetical protein
VSTGTLQRRAARLDPDVREVCVAFVGRRVEHAAWALSGPARGVDPVWVERGEDLLARLRDAAPDLVVVFRPDIVPAGLVRELDCTTLAVLPDALPLEWGDPDVWDPMPWLGESLRLAGGLGPELEGFAREDYDRVIAADPLLARVAPELGLWRSPPLPVDDAFFFGDRGVPRPLRPLFLGESTAHREDMLLNPKHVFDLSHYASGLEGERLREVLAATNVGVVVHPGRFPGFPPTLPLHLAAGHLVVSEPLMPTRGLEPGLDHVVVAAVDQLMRILAQLAARPAAFEQVRLRGRARAEAFRASRAWPRLISDLAADLLAFGG